MTEAGGTQVAAVGTADAGTRAGFTLEVRPVFGIGEVRPGDDLADVIAGAAPWLADADVLVVTSKIVSKAEGRLVPVPAEPGPERDAARDAALAAETARVVARRGGTRIVQTHHGLVLAGAGIDASNVTPDRLVLLPADPDASARRLRAALRERYGLDVAVVVTDTMGRPWRLGLTDTAIGAAGIEPLRDHRGQADGYGNELHLTQLAVIDELAAAAELVKGKIDQVPVAVVRGYPVVPGAPDGPGASALVRDASMDLFSMGTAEARAVGLGEAAELADAAAFGAGVVELDLVRRAVKRVGGVFDLVDVPADAHGLPARTAVLLIPAVGEVDAPGAAARTGAAVHRVRAALAAEGLASAWVFPQVVGGWADRVGADPEFGVVAVGLPDVSG